MVLNLAGGALPPTPNNAKYTTSLENAERERERSKKEEFGKDMNEKDY